jgi:arsenate reductase
MDKLKVLFLSEGNCCRSQMAEGFAKKWGSDVMIPMSAGVHPDASIRPEAIKYMKEAGVDISSQHPKAIEDVEFPDVVISMDAENPCSIPDVVCLDWSLASPEGRDEAFYKRVRDIIASRVRVLIQDIKDGDLI